MMFHLFPVSASPEMRCWFVYKVTHVAGKNAVTLLCL